MKKEKLLLPLFLLVFFLAIPKIWALVIDVKLVPGWNMISLPYQSGTIDVSSCGSDINSVIPAIYHYNSQSRNYESLSTINRMRAGIGYWVYLDSEKECGLKQNVSVNYRRSVLYNLGDKRNGTLVAGWNQIGGTTSPARLNPAVLDAAAKANRGDCNIEIIYYYDPKVNSYVPVASIEQGKAYWIYVEKECVLSAEPDFASKINSHTYYSSMQKCSSHYDCESKLCSNGLCAPSPCGNKEYFDFLENVDLLQYLPLDALRLTDENKKFVDENNILIYSYDKPSTDKRQWNYEAALKWVHEENHGNYIVDQLQLFPSKDFLPKYLILNGLGIPRPQCGHGIEGGSDSVPPSFSSTSVILHESGHIYMEKYMEKFLRSDDPNTKVYEFIDISWDLKPGGDRTSLGLGYVPKPGLCIDSENYYCKGFATTYSLWNPMEDFAEVFMFYIVHGDYFREWIQYDEVAKKKYDWLKNNVFDGREYHGSPYAFDNLRHHYMLGQRWSLVYSDERKALIEYQKALADIKKFSAQEENAELIEYSDVLQRTVLRMIKFSCGRSNATEVQELCQQYILTDIKSINWKLQISTNAFI